MSDYRNLIVYQKAFDNAMLVFKITKTFPPTEKFSLTTQIRNSSHSVCSNIAEGYRKRRYVNHFVSKLSDADMENSESIGWLDFSLACYYITDQGHKDMISSFEEVGKILNYIIQQSRQVSLINGSLRTEDHEVHARLDFMVN